MGMENFEDEHSSYVDYNLVRRVSAYVENHDYNSIVSTYSELLYNILGFSENQRASSLDKDRAIWGFSRSNENCE